VAGLAITPHLLLEGVAYVVAAVGAIFMSKAALKYSLKDSVFWEITRSCSVIFLVSGLLLTVGCLFEAHWAPHWLGQLR
jgi:uncharacterized membrane protein SpoIIM required for sporulation